MLSKIVIICVMLIVCFWLVCFGIAFVRTLKRAIRKKKAGTNEDQNGVPDEKITIEDQVIAILNREDGSREVIKNE